MKLYTEEQVIKIVNKAFWQDIGNANDATELMSELTPIELLSDEEIYLRSETQSEHSLYNMGFKYGAKWVIERIKQQEK